MVNISKRARSRLIRIMALNTTKYLYDTILTAIHLYVRNTEKSMVQKEVLSVRLGNFKSIIDLSSDSDESAMILTLTTKEDRIVLTFNLKEGNVGIDTTYDGKDATKEMEGFRENLQSVFKVGGNVYEGFPLTDSPTAKDAIRETIDEVVGSGHNIVSASFQLAVTIPSIGLLND